MKETDEYLNKRGVNEAAGLEADEKKPSRHYPEDRMQFHVEYGPDVTHSWQRFFDLREELLLGYGWQTARAYWADLQSWFEWAVERDKDVLALSENDQAQYRALMRRRKYSENTIRRRGTALRLLYGLMLR